MYHSISHSVGALRPLATLAFTVAGWALVAYQSVFVVALAGTALRGVDPWVHGASALGGGLMLSLAGYLLLRASPEPAVRILTAFLILFVPVGLMTAEASISRLFRLAGLHETVVWIADGLGGHADPLLEFAIAHLPEHLVMLAVLAFLLLTMNFPRRLAPADIPDPKGRGGVFGAILGPAMRVPSAARRALLMRPVFVGFGAVFWVLTLYVLDPPGPQIAALLVVFLGLWYLRDGYRVADPADRRRITWALGGMSLGFGMMSVAFIVHLLGPGGRMVRSVAEGVLWFTPPVAIGLTGVGVLYRGALDPTLALRRTTVYGVLGLLLAVTFAGVEEVATEWVFSRLGLPDAFGAALAAGVVIIFFNPLRRRLGGLGERFLVGDTDAPATPGVAARSALVAARLPHRDETPDADEISEASVLRRCARRVARDQEGRLVRKSESGVVLAFSGAGPALRGARALLASLAEAQEMLVLEGGPPGLALHLEGPGGDVGREIDSGGMALVEELAHRAGSGDLLITGPVLGDPELMRALRTRPGDPAFHLEGGMPIYRVPLTADGRPSSVRIRAVAPAVAGIGIILLLPALAMMIGPRRADQLPEDATAALVPAEDTLFSAGVNLTDDEARGLRARLAEAPNDVDVRGLLLRYHCSSPSFLDRWRAYGHALWFLRHRPEDPVSDRVVSCLPRDGGEYDEARAVLLRHAEMPEPHPTVLLNAGILLHGGGELDAAAGLLERGRSRAPADPRWYRHLGLIRGRRGDHGEAAALFAEEVRLRPRSRHRIFALTSLLRAAHRADILASYDAQARELVELAEALAADTSFQAGIYYHAGKTALGLVAMEREEVREAIHHLLTSLEGPAAARPPWWAETALAEALLRRGVSSPVVSYLETARGRVSSEGTSVRIGEWLEAVRHGERADFRGWGLF